LETFIITLVTHGNVEQSIKGIGRIESKLA